MHPRNAKPGGCPRHGATLPNPSWRGAVPGSCGGVGVREAERHHHPPGRQWSKPPQGGRVAGNRTWRASKSSVTQKVGKTSRRHCPGTRGLHPPRTGDPAPRLAPPAGGRLSPSARPWCLETADAQGGEGRALGGHSAHRSARSHLVSRSTGDLSEHYAQSKATTLQKGRNFTQTFKKSTSPVAVGNFYPPAKTWAAKSMITLLRASAAEQN